MAMNFEELNEQTRQRMLDEFEQEQAGPQPFVSKRLTPAGKAAFPELMRKAILEGNEETLEAELADSSFWYPTETNVSGERKVNIRQAKERLARNEFNTWYVRGFARRLLDEGVAECQIYRAAPPKWDIAACSEHEGEIRPVQEVYDGHRAKYWPPPGDPEADSIPFQPGCHHTIKRI